MAQGGNLREITKGLPGETPRRIEVVASAEREMSKRTGGN